MILHFSGDKLDRYVYAKVKNSTYPKMFGMIDFDGFIPFWNSVDGSAIEEPSIGNFPGRVVPP